ncbi:MAG: Mur ligase family protein [Chloroflexota bacterium]|nr:Mur ligase family protein [Chloroflexota bacterium]
MVHGRYFEAVDYLQRRLWHELPIVPVERALQHRVLQVLAHLGDPHLAFPAIHVAGSAGKGSTAAIAASILRAAGLRTGIYTKPHLQTFIERADVDGRLMASDAFAEAVLGLDPLVRKMHLDVIDGVGFGRPSLVEVAFAVCMRHFADERVDVAVVEAGLGGRTDYSNVFDEKAATIITNVSYEHRERLGWSLPSIAEEKAAIIRRDPVITGASGEALRVIAARCASSGAPLLRLKHEVRALIASADARGSKISIRTPSRRIERARLALAGAHQAENAALAVAAVDAYAASTGIDISDEQIRSGLASVRLSGRLEQVQDRPRVLLDAAHNPAEARRFAQTVRDHWLAGGPRVHLVAGILADKDQAPMVRAFASIADRVLLTQPPLGERIGDPSRMLALFRRELGDANVRFEPSHDRAFDIALADASAGDLICVTGSMFLVGALRERWVPERRILERRTAALEVDRSGG